MNNKKLKFLIDYIFNDIRSLTTTITAENTTLPEAIDLINLIYEIVYAFHNISNYIDNDGEVSFILNKLKHNYPDKYNEYINVINK